MISVIEKSNCIEKRKGCSLVKFNKMFMHQFIWWKMMSIQ